MPTPPRGLLLSVLCSLSPTPAACADVCLDCGVEPTLLPDLLCHIERKLGVRTIKKDGAVRVAHGDWLACRRLCEDWWDAEGPGAVVVRESARRRRSAGLVAAAASN